jgi:Domain of unknown function (DUF6431)
MKIPYFAGDTLITFVNCARSLGQKVTQDGTEWTIYEAAVEAPVGCLAPHCGSVKRLRGNGSYGRQVIEGLVFVIIMIRRFRCVDCGGTVSRPPSFLVPYRRFTAQVVSAAIEQYAENARSYEGISLDLSQMHEEGTADGKNVSAWKTKPNEEIETEDSWRPFRSTVFHWVDYACKRIKTMVQQTEKELVRRRFDIETLPLESQVCNVNAEKTGIKAYGNGYKYQHEKPEELNMLTYGIMVATHLINSSETKLQKLRTYFLEKAENCRELLSDVMVVLPIAHSFDQGT